MEELQKSRDLSLKEDPPKSILKLNQNVETLNLKKEGKDLKRHSLQIAMSSKRDSRRELLEENKTQKSNDPLRATSMDDSVSRLRFEPENVLIRESNYEETRKNVDAKQKIEKETEIVIKEVT